jgi:hypothetical protein
MRHPIGQGLVREIREVVRSKDEEREMYARLRMHLDGFRAWRPYVPPDDIPPGSYRPSCNRVGGPAELAADGRCGQCWGTVAP